MNHTPFPERDHLPDSARQDKKVTKRDRVDRNTLRFCGYVLSGGETEMSQKFSGQRIFSPNIILENLNQRSVSNEEYHCNAQAHIRYRQKPRRLAS